MAGIYRPATFLHFAATGGGCIAAIDAKGPVLRTPRIALDTTERDAAKRPQGAGRHLFLFLCGIMLIPVLLVGCSHTDERSLSQEANDFFNQGNYAAALSRYEEIFENHPAAADR